MQRRTFVHYSLVAGSAVLLPDVAEAGTLGRLYRAARFCTRLHPARFVAGLVFDGVSEVALRPVRRSRFRRFVKGVRLAKSTLEYFDSPSQMYSERFDHDPYKAATAIYGVSDYEVYAKARQERVRLLLTRDVDKRRFDQIVQYYRDERVKLKCFDEPKTFYVGRDLEPDDLFNIDYIAFKGEQRRHYENLLSLTENRAFSELVV